MTACWSTNPFCRCLPFFNLKEENNNFDMLRNRIILLMLPVGWWRPSARRPCWEVIPPRDRTAQDTQCSALQPRTIRPTHLPLTAKPSKVGNHQDNSCASVPEPAWGDLWRKLREQPTRLKEGIWLARRLTAKTLVRQDWFHYLWWYLGPIM